MGRLRRDCLGGRALCRVPARGPAFEQCRAGATRYRDTWTNSTGSTPGAGARVREGAHSFAYGHPSALNAHSFCDARSTRGSVQDEGAGHSDCWANRPRALYRKTVHTGWDPLWGFLKAYLNGLSG